jgi:hypothetical protein
LAVEGLKRDSVKGAIEAEGIKFEVWRFWESLILQDVSCF